MLAAQELPEGTPWWAKAALTALGILAGAFGTYMTVRWGTGGKEPKPGEGTPAPGPATGLVPAPPTTPLPVLVNSPHTVDGQLELAKLLNEQSQRERQDLQTRLERTEQRLNDTEGEVENLKQRVAELAGINAQLHFLLERAGFPPPPLGPPPVGPRPG